jgi:fucose 4-O-acetylase-like acetyltransferase
MPAHPETPPAASGPTVRNDFLDLVKGWLIFLVVCGHSIQFLGFRSVAFDSSAEYYFDPLYKLIYSFHMALFIGISGYFAWGAIQKRSFTGFTKVRAVQILVPLVVWSVMRHLAGPSVKALSHLDALPLLEAFRAFPVWDLGLEIWFLWAVFISGFLVSLSQCFGRWRMAALVAGFVFLLLLPQGEVIKLSAFTYPFFVGGYWIAEKKLAKLPSMPVLLASLLLWCVTLLLWQPATFVYVSGMEWRGNLTNLGVRYLGGITGSVVFLAAVWWLSIRWKPSLVIRWGRESLAIYIIQTYLFFPLIEMNHLLRDWRFFDITVAPVFAALVCCLGLVVAWAIRKNRYAAALLLGVPLPLGNQARRI